MNEDTKRITLAAGPLQVSCSDIGGGQPYLLLHGGAGPQSMAGLSAALAAEGRAITPVHPGFAGTPRPGWCHRVQDLADAYLALIDMLDLQGVIVIGNSVGGWLAAEIALRDSPRVAAIVLINACGIDTGSPDKPIPDPMALPPAELRLRDVVLGRPVVVVSLPVHAEPLCEQERR